MTEEDLNQLIILSFRLSNLMDVGTPILRALDSCVEAMATERMREALSGVRESASMGSSLTNAFGEHPDVFDSFFVDMVRTGEERGTLDETLMKLSHALEREKSLHQRHRATLEQELPGAVLDALSSLKRRGLHAVRIVADPEECSFSARPQRLAEAPELERWANNIQGFRRGLMSLVGIGDQEAVQQRGGKVLGTPPFFLRVVSLPRLAGEELEVTLHDYPEDPPPEDSVVLPSEIEDNLWNALYREGAGVLLLAEDAISCRLSMAWILTRWTREHSRRCAWIAGSHWPPVRGITQVPAETLALGGAEETWESLQVFDYHTVGVGPLSGIPAESLSHLREAPVGLLWGGLRGGAGKEGSIPGGAGDMVSLFATKDGGRTMLTSH